MPRKRASVQEALPEESGVSELARSLVVNAPLVGPVPVAISSAVKDPVRRVQAPDSLSSVTQRLGATVWESNATFDWARRVDRSHFTFTRWYIRQNVILDVFNQSNAQVYTEATLRGAAVRAENQRRVAAGKPPFGYLPIVRHVVVADEAFDRAIRGEVLPLLDRSPEGVWS